MSTLFASHQILIVAVIVALAMYGFIKEMIRSDLVALATMALLVLTGILTAEEAVRGFSNPATMIVACMLVVSAAFVAAGTVGPISNFLFRLKRFGPNAVIITMMLVVGTISAFINNTATVAVFIPIVLRLSRELEIDAKRMLLPLSFAAIFGGSCTLIGTSTNVLVNSIYVKAGFSGFSLLEFSSVGLLLACIGVIYLLVVMGLGLLSRTSEAIPTKLNNYLTEVVVSEESPSANVEFHQSLFYKDFKENIVEVFRSKARMNLHEDFQLQAGDQISLLCGLEKIESLKNRVGVHLLAKSEVDPDVLKEHEVYEVIVPVNSELVGRTLRDISLLHGNEIIPLAVRHSGRIRYVDIIDYLIRPGDVIVLSGKRALVESFERDERLILLSHVARGTPNFRKLFVTLAVTGAIVCAVLFGLIDILGASLVGAVILLLTKTISLRDAYAAFDAKVLILLGAILSLGAALEKTGADQLIANFLTGSLQQFGPVVILSVLYLITSLLTEIMSNNATAALLAPVAIGIAHSLGLSEKPFLVAVMLAGSASFMTPFGYQTNTLIYSAGAFRFTDFLKIGIPLNILFWLAATFLIPRFFSF